MGLKKEQHDDDEARPIRIEHSPDDEIIAEDQQGWAVSYSDLLMVLMSFFVLFFSFDPAKTEDGKDVIREISTTLMQKTGIHSPAVAADIFKPSSAGSQTTAQADIPTNPNGQSRNINSALEPALKSLGSKYSMESERETLIIHLKDDLYAPRSRAVTGELQASLEVLLIALKPYASDIDLYFIGHSDTKPVSDTSGIVKDNHVLSALRATEALEFALSKGFPSNRLFSLGAAENMRSSRTLSIKIVPK
jgi:flagellar motor protein MotB